MTNRWKYQLKTGLFWGLFMTIAMLLFEMRETPISEQLQRPGFYVRTLIYVLVGVFLLGYVNWRSVRKNQS